MNSIRKITALFYLYFACCTEIDLHSKKILTRFNSLKSKDPWFVKYSTQLFSARHCARHPSIQTHSDVRWRLLPAITAQRSALRPTSRWATCWSVPSGRACERPVREHTAAGRQAPGPGGSSWRSPWQTSFCFKTRNVCVFRYPGLSPSL